jgi:hypothetical protein
MKHKLFIRQVKKIPGRNEEYSSRSGKFPYSGELLLPTI